MRLIVFAAAAAACAAACTPQTTSFRPTDRIDGSSERAGPTAAVYDLTDARVHVWSTGGFIGTSDDPMTHVGIEIQNLGKRPIVFDGDAVALAIYDANGGSLPVPMLTSIVPLGPAQLEIKPATTVILDTYFKMPVPLAQVARMRVRWSLKFGDERHVDVTNFVRDD